MRKARVIMVVAGVCGVIFAAGGATAALASIPSATGVIHGCYGTTGLLRVISGTSCRTGEKALSWTRKAPRVRPVLLGQQVQQGRKDRRARPGQVTSTTAP